MATYVIGDIHGRCELLRRLLTTFTPCKDDIVVFLGDYIDRGPDSRGVVEALIRYRESSDADVKFLMGNHESVMLRSLSDLCRHTWIISWPCDFPIFESIVRLQLADHQDLPGLICQTEHSDCCTGTHE